jgi:hypothetical protein
MELDYIGVVAITGDEGSCKSTMALTFPTSIFHFDLDVGGFDRAAWRLVKDNPKLKVYRAKQSEDISALDIDGYDIITKPYPRPLQESKLMGQLTGTEVKSASVRTLKQPKKVEGMKELWQDIISDFVYICKRGTKSIVFDSATMLWQTCHNARLQELQEVQEYKWKTSAQTSKLPFPEDEYRERLQPIEYGQPNERMTSLIQASRSFRKNLILTHYPTDEYGMIADGKGGLVEGKTGKQISDGFKNTGKLCDLVVWTSIKETATQGTKTGRSAPVRTPIAKIIKCGIEGMGLDAVGQEISASYDGVIGLRNIMRGEE